MLRSGETMNFLDIVRAEVDRHHGKKPTDETKVARSLRVSRESHARQISLLRRADFAAHALHAVTLVQHRPPHYVHFFLDFIFH
jgi:hypothetical protein